MRKYVTVFPSKSEQRRETNQSNRMGFSSHFTSKVSAEAFVRAWVSSSTLQEVADKTGLTYAAVGARGRAYIKKGVKLPMLQKKGPGSPNVAKVPVADLNELIAATKR